MARRRHVMTAKRRTALRKAQLASARKRRGSGNVKRRANVKRRPGHRVSPRTRRNIRRTAIGVGVLGAAGGAGYVTYDRATNVRLYHNTPNKNLKSIKVNGLTGVKVGSYSNTVFGERPGDVYVTAGMNMGKPFGNGTVKLKVKRSEFHRIASRDRNMPKVTRAYKIRQEDLVGKKVRTRRGGPYRTFMFHAAFPDGTKESYRGKT